MPRFLKNFSFSLLAFVLSYAQDNDEILKKLQNAYIRDLPYPNVLLDSYDMSFGNKTYFVTTMQNYNKDRYGDKAYFYNCIEVFEDSSSRQKFCFNGDSIINLENKESFFTIKTYKQDRIGNIANTYLTFRLINGKFYLHQYSREKKHFDANDEEVVDKALVYYFQDDSKEENLIPLESVNDELLQKLELKYNAKY
ncbi:hypothetical protein [Helicobacter sp. MIT 05-5294]|uniref:hypothetical protein n=1 Tax=Helicobacter sp. MIT 05-5294 TaxID=1548150 RepID=UPI0010FF51EF|nr:hypothetical protein [Helicobacter sp. MIT 05-5294]TLD83758.1 hypothetical protein LS69_010035 [Helicobacter sp. MIT 05-5294]